MRIHLQQTDSTNRVAREQAVTGAPSGSVVWADSQVAGKGQHGRSFVSPMGGLYFSLILRPELPPERLPLITLATGLACRDILANHYNLNAQLKWPNDLFLHGKKVGGILCESFFEQQAGPSRATVIIGVGINCNGGPEDFPTALQPLVTTIAQVKQALIEIPLLLERLVEAVEESVLQLGGKISPLLDRWQEHDYLLGQSLRYTHGTEEITGVGKGISHDGRYRLTDDQGREHTIVGGQLRPLNWPVEPRPTP